MNEKLHKFRVWVQRIIFFFPIQLLLAHIKRSQILIVFWLLFFGLVTQQLAQKFGIPHLLLYPEYLGHANFLSHVVLGLAYGSFIVAYQVSSYIIFGYRFPFIATLNKPFLKYSINNFIVPVLFSGVYFFQIADFQLKKELLGGFQVMMHLSGLLTGTLIFIVISYSYFLSTNKSILKFRVSRKKKPSQIYRPIRALFDRSVKWYHFLKRNSEWKIDTYITGRLRIKMARSSSHYSKETLKKVFQQNHLNASMFELGAIFSLILVGAFMEHPLFAIPAGASILLLFTMTLMLSSALHSWLKGWSVIGYIVLALILNELSKQPYLRRQNMAYGMNYTEQPQVYDNKTIDALLLNETKVRSAHNDEIHSLNEWKSHVKGKKNLILITTSGGGLRSALWTFYGLSYIDSVCSNNILDQTRLISGASGGMIGAAYYRESHLHRKLTHEKLNSRKYAQLLSKDMLNPLAFSWVVNDFIRLKKFSYKNQIYYKDRAYYFENQLNVNTEGMLDKSISYYRPFVRQGRLPMIVLSPTIVNDGRRLLISSIPVNFLYQPILKAKRLKKDITGFIDFQTFFKHQWADSLKYTSALRMNATFPFVLPNTYLPCQPSVEVMDAGIRDNFGLKTAALYMNAMETWLKDSVDQILIVRFFDRPNVIKVNQDPYHSFLHSVSKPVGNVYNNLFNTQRLQEIDILSGIPNSLRGKVETINFVLHTDSMRNIPLSWQLTQLEKNLIRDAFFTPVNENAIQRLKYHLK